MKYEVLDELLKTKSIIEALRYCEVLEHELRTHFYFGNDLWNALFKHLQNDNNGLVEHPKDYLIIVHRGSGHAIRFADARVGPGEYVTHGTGHSKHVKPSHVYYTVEIEYVHEEDKDREWPPTTCRKFSFAVPNELVLSFDQGKFDSWVNGKVDEQRKKRKAEALKAFKALLAEFPELRKAVRNRENS